MESHVTHMPPYTLTIHHKHCTLLYYLVRLQNALVGSVFSSISSLLEERTATATHHRLAQGWVNAKCSRNSSFGCTTIMPDYSC